MRRVMALTLALLCLVPGCSQEESEAASEVRYSLWFAVSPGAREEFSSAVAQEDRAWEGEPTARELMAALLKGPEEEGLRSPFPRGVAVRTLTPGENGVLQVDLSEQYGGLTGLDLTLADYCIVLTLCQLSEVEAVRVTVEGETIPYRNRQVLGVADVLLSGISEEPETFFAVLYFPRRDGLGLGAEYRSVDRREGTEKAAVLIEELLRGPLREGGGLPLPEGTQLHRVMVDGGVCRVDLSREFVENMPQSEGQAVLVLYALVDTLCALGDVERVQILVEGETLDAYGGVSLEAPLEASQDLVRTD